MFTSTIESYISDPVYRAALRHFQLGEWEPGLIELDKLIEAYPLEPELRLLRQEMRLRAGIDEDERQDIAQARRNRVKKTAGRLFLLIVVAGVIVWGAVSYFVWFQQQVAEAQQAMTAQMQAVELSVKFEDASRLLQVGRADVALGLFQEIQAVDPAYAGLSERMAEAERAVALEAKYNDAMRLINLQDYRAALALLEEVAAEEPNYKGVALQIQNLKRRFLQDDTLVQANTAFDTGRWADAADAYETVRALDPDYQKDVIEERLYRSYLNAAVGILAEDTDSLEALEKADEYFRKALVLRPQDPELKGEREAAQATLFDRLFNSYLKEAQAILIEQGDTVEALVQADEYFQKALKLHPDDAGVQIQRELAALYLHALDSYNKGDWNAVITDLEVVYAQDTDYALGTARQTLYEAYAARGYDGMVSGAFESALADFQRAAVLAQDDPDSAMLLYESQLNVAEAQGAVGNYEQAVLMFQTAVEEADLRTTLLVDKPDLLGKLEEAEVYADGRNFWRAYRLYREATRNFQIALGEVEVTVGDGQYLTQIANQYNTTVDAIKKANDITGKGITPGTKLVIPTYDK